MSGPSINRAESSGDIWTPWPFIRAVEEAFCELLIVDLAASGKESAKAAAFITPEIDSLKENWDTWFYQYRVGTRGALWLNPPYSNIAPWARKCANTYVFDERVEIFLLVPASVGVNWFWDYVWDYATVYSVGRMVFDNCFDRKSGQLVSTVYPKDLILCHYTNTSPSRTLQRWPWKSSIAGLASTVSTTAGTGD